ncbi:MAG: type II secretion system protein GspI [Candidatus Schekmanbacteria bacterium]|nr:MAG: type II secretion system protein GspI [Candidatus Schekmanbacteria bacterium]
MSGMNVRYKRVGFTFLEIMIALAIISIALIAALRAQSQSIRTAAEMAEKVKLLNMARMKMAEVELYGFPDTGEEEGEFEDYPGYKWKTEVKPVSSSLLGIDAGGIELSFDELRLVKLTIYDENKENILFELESLVAKKE